MTQRQYLYVPGLPEKKKCCRNLQKELQQRQNLKLVINSQPKQVVKPRGSSKCVNTQKLSPIPKVKKNRRRRGKGGPTKVTVKSA